MNIGRKRIDEKHHIEATAQGSSINDFVVDVQIIKTTNGQAIPDDEPIILFRGRDKLALPMLNHYRMLCANDGATDYQLASMDTMINEFREWWNRNPTKMKQPGCTLGK